jgi:penicillin-binding protein 2
MRRVFLEMLVIGLMLTGCNQLPGMQEAGQGGAPAAATPVPNLDDALSVAGTFLNAWVNRDYDGMYGLITRNSRDAYPLEVFRAAYEEANKQMTLIDMEVEILTGVLQGVTAGVAYDAHFHTQLLGDFSDTERTLYLLPTTEGWRVAWSPSDIFFEMVRGASLSLERIVPARANIYDRNGRVIADQNGTAISVMVVPQDMPDEEGCVNELARVLRLPTETIQEKYANRPTEWVTIIDEIDVETYQVEAETLTNSCNAIFEERRTRRYFGGGLASHVVGYVGYIPREQCAEWELRGYTCDDLVGRVGIEKWGEETLAGRRGGRLSVTTPGGERLRIIAARDPQPSQAVYLTIDRDLQVAVQQAISDAYNYAANNFARISTGAAAVVMDVNTGEILAMASYPWFDPNLYNPDTPRNAQAELETIQNDPRRPQLNRAAQGQYPPGSIFKVVTMTAAADSGYFGLNQTYRCTGEWFQPDGFRRIDWLAGGHGVITLRQSLTYSCDVYNYQIGLELDQHDPSLLGNYAREMGLGEPTGVEQIDEAEGLIPDPDWVRTERRRQWTYNDDINMAIGQGDVLATPLQVARTMAAVANGGTLYEPQLVHHIGLIGEEPSWTFTPVLQRQVDIDPEMLTAVREALCAVTTDPNGTATWRFEGVEVPTCGKTGTAQAGGAQAYPHAWFAAFAPAEEPEIAVVVLVEHAGEGSWVAAPIVRRIIEEYYGVTVAPYPVDWEYELPVIEEGASLGE